MKYTNGILIIAGPNATEMWITTLRQIYDDYYDQENKDWLYPDIMQYTGLSKKVLESTLKGLNLSR
jgi:hypothetical protein